MRPRKEPASRPTSHVRIPLPDRLPRHFAPTFRSRLSLRSVERRRDVTRGDRASSSVLTLQLGFSWGSFATQLKRYSQGDEELLRGRETVLARLPATRFGQQWINCRTVVVCYVARGLNRGRHENGSFQRNEIGLTTMGLYSLISESSWLIQPTTIVMTESRPGQEEKAIGCLIDGQEEIELTELMDHYDTDISIWKMNRNTIECFLERFWWSWHCAWVDIHLE